MNNQEQNQTTEALQNAFNQFANSNTIETQQVTEDQAQQVNTNANGNAQTTQTSQNTQDEEATNKAFAKYRTENANLTRQLNEFSASVKAMGYENVEDFMAKAASRQVENNAKANGVPTEWEKRLQALEAENQRYRQNERQRVVQLEISELVDEYKVTKDEWGDFIKYLQQQNINPYESNVSLKSMYIERNLQSIIDKRVEEEKQKWLTQYQASNAPISTISGVSRTISPKDTKQVDWATLASKFKK